MDGPFRSSPPSLPLSVSLFPLRSLALCSVCLYPTTRGRRPSCFPPRSAPLPLRSRRPGDQCVVPLPPHGRCDGLVGGAVKLLLLLRCGPSPRKVPRPPVVFNAASTDFSRRRPARAAFQRTGSRADEKLCATRRRRGRGKTHVGKLQQRPHPRSLLPTRFVRALPQESRGVCVWEHRWSAMAMEPTMTTKTTAWLAVVVDVRLPAIVLLSSALSLRLFSFLPSSENAAGQSCWRETSTPRRVRGRKTSQPARNEIE